LQNKAVRIPATQLQENYKKNCNTTKFYCSCVDHLSPGDVAYCEGESANILIPLVLKIDGK